MVYEIQGTVVVWSLPEGGFEAIAEQMRECLALRGIADLTVERSMLSGSSVAAEVLGYATDEESAVATAKQVMDCAESLGLGLIIEIRDCGSANLISHQIVMPRQG
jgi:hypothetical protein